MKLTEVQRFQLRQAYDNAQRVLREIKSRRLNKKEIVDMKILEDAVINLELLIIG